MNPHKMKFPLFVISLILFHAAYTQSLSDVASDSVVDIKTQQKFVFKTSPSVAESFGYYSSVGNPALSVYNVILHDSLLFFSDACFDNVKKFEIQTGRLTCSKCFSPEKYRGMCEIAIMNERLFAFFFSGDVVVFDFDLNPLHEFKIPDFVGFSNVIAVTDSSLSVYRRIGDVIQNSERYYVVNYIKIKDNFSISNDSIIYKDHSDFYSKVQKSIQGQAYFVSQNNQQFVLSNSYGNYGLDRNIPSTSQYYDSKNLYFTQNRISFFEVVNNSLIVYLYSY